MTRHFITKPLLDFTNVTQTHHQPPDIRLWKWQTGSILCLAWEQLLGGNRDHKSSLSAATPAAALNAKCREETWVASRVEKAPSAPSSLGSISSTRLILKSCLGVCDVTTGQLTALGIKSVWTASDNYKSGTHRKSLAAECFFIIIIICMIIMLMHQIRRGRNTGTKNGWKGL